MTREFFVKVITALCANVEKFENAKDLLTECKLLDAGPMQKMKLAFLFTTKTKAPQYRLKKVFKVLCSHAIKEDCKRVHEKICVAAKDLANEKAEQHLCPALIVTNSSCSV